MYISEKAIFPLTNLALQIEGFEREDLLNIQMQKGNNEPYIKNGIYYIPDDRRDEKIEQYFVSQNLEQKFKVIKQLTGNASVNIEKGE
ncbi:MAG: hypothetical protein LBD75_06605 [Candidatus Peribacteria bacterium]|jgi:hypothetical protein|nr:hypothetical protein [Candidatus Peribacteria bacterium]